MNKKLAIKGHQTRGKEIIELLEMMGGDNRWKASGNIEKVYYSISNGSIIYSPQLEKGTVVFTLEKFLEKYPYKVRDIVDRTLDYVSCIIDNMRWNSEKCCVEYHLNYLNGSEYGWHVSDCLIKHENEDVIIGTKIESTGFMQMGKTVSVIFNSANYEDEVELQLGDYKIEVRDGKTYAVRKKPKYPKTYKECCEVIGINRHNVEIDLPQPYQQKMFNIFKLLICCDAYWKIAGEEMDLDKPWKPDWKNTKNVKYGITLHNDIITKMYLRNENAILAFQHQKCEMLSMRTLKI